MNILIETPRLIIRELLPSDEEGMFAMDNDAEVHRYLGNKPYADIQQSRDNIAFIQQQYAEHGIGRWAVILKETGDFVGWTGFKHMVEPVNGHVNHLDFGYRHARPYWGQGYGYEAAKASLDYGIEQLGFRDIYAMTDVENKGSRRILEKLDFQLKEIFAYDGPSFWVEGLPVTWYELHVKR
jgi:ribosomal-protein-alanine N-acetyltransferase